MIKSHEPQFTVVLMCRALSVSKAGYYHWKNRSPSPRAQVSEQLMLEVKRVFDDENARASVPRIAKRLNDEGHRAHRKTVAQIMKAQGWRAKAARKYKATTTSNHSLPVALNLLNQNFEADRPDQKWVSDIACIWTKEGWLYLAVVLDLYARRGSAGRFQNACLPRLCVMHWPWHFGDTICLRV
jgi:putative transposase